MLFVGEIRHYTTTMSSRGKKGKKGRGGAKLPKGLPAGFDIEQGGMDIPGLPGTPGMPGIPGLPR